MQPNKSDYVLADQEAPENKELLIEQAFDGIMKLTEEDKLFLSAISSKKYRAQILDLLYK